MAIGLIHVDNWLRGSSVGFMQDLGLEILGILIRFSDYITALYNNQLPANFVNASSVYTHSTGYTCPYVCRALRHIVNYALSTTLIIMELH